VKSSSTLPSFVTVMSSASVIWVVDAATTVPSAHVLDERLIDRFWIVTVTLMSDVSAAYAVELIAKKAVTAASAQMRRGRAIMLDSFPIPYFELIRDS
jgi:hypothetical protein